MLSDLRVAFEPVSQVKFSLDRIEINPRLTTSYVGLRSLAKSNLAKAMIEIIEQKQIAVPVWKRGKVRFWPDGRVDEDDGDIGKGF